MQQNGMTTPGMVLALQWLLLDRAAERLLAGAACLPALFAEGAAVVVPPAAARGA